jgi:hypothetical protein
MPIPARNEGDTVTAMVAKEEKLQALQEVPNKSEPEHPRGAHVALSRTQKI